MPTCQTIDGNSFWIEDILFDCYYGIKVIDNGPLVEAIAEKGQLIDPCTPQEFRNICEDSSDHFKENIAAEQELLKEFDMDELA